MGLGINLPPGTLGDRNHNIILPRIDGEVWSFRRDRIRPDGSDRPVHVQLHREEGPAGFPRGLDHGGLFESKTKSARLLDIDRDSGHNQSTHSIHSGNGRVHPMSVSFRYPALCRAVLFFAFCVLYAGFGGLKLIHGFAAFQVISMFAAVILIPLYFFVKEGIQPVYDGIRLYHPYMLVINKYDLWSFLFAGLLVGFGQFFFDLTSWQRLFMIEMKKVRLTFSLSGLIWIIFPLSFSSLFIMVIFTGGFTDIHSILAGLANKITTPFFFILFVLCAFSAITSTFGACLHSLVSLIVANILEPLQTKKATSKK